MKIEGTIGEFIELQTIGAENSQVFEQAESGSLTVLWFLEDDNKLEIDGVSYIFNQNQIVFLTEFHKVQVQTIGAAKYLKFNRPFFCVLDHDAEVGCKGLLFFGNMQLPYIDITEEHLSEFEALWRMFCKELDSNDKLQIEMLQMLLKRYLILCTRLYKAQHEVAQAPAEHNLIREFNFLVEQHYTTKHTVADYAELLNKSPKTISNIFSKLGTKTPLSYIHDRRMIEARRLLKHTNLQVSEIAYKIGYEDIQSFSRFFKKQEGISPSDYRGF